MFTIHIGLQIVCRASWHTMYLSKGQTHDKYTDVSLKSTSSAHISDITGPKKCWARRGGWGGFFLRCLFTHQMPLQWSQQKQSWMEEIRECARKSGSCAKAGGWGVMIYDPRQRWQYEQTILIFEVTFFLYVRGKGRRGYIIYTEKRAQITRIQLDEKNPKQRIAQLS